MYSGALPASGDLTSGCEALFRENGWEGAWRDGVFPYHHYHRIVHEVLGIVRGSARLTFGGESGVAVKVETGDAAVILTGVGHCNSESSDDFLVGGAYPRGQSWDLRTGKSGERSEILENIRRVPLPWTDRVFGVEGPLAEPWAR